MSMSVYVSLYLLICSMHVFSYMSALYIEYSAVQHRAIVMLYQYGNTTKQGFESRSHTSPDRA